MSKHYGTKHNVFAGLQHNRFAIASPFIVVAIFYFLLFGPRFLENLMSPSWMIAPTMVLGSFVAGSTFLGGGAVAFPVLTKLMNVDPVTAKTFSLCIQSVGMTSASVYIVMKVRNLPWGFILLYVIASGLGVLLSLLFLEDRIPSADLRVCFTLFLLCFLPVYLLTRNSRNVLVEPHLEKRRSDVFLTLVCGCVGGLVSGLIGSGADLIGFSVLALYFRFDIKRATLTSVILMASTSLMGVALQAFAFDRVSDQVVSLWYVAAPVVLFGAPIGVLFCRRVPQKVLIYFISAVVITEFVSTLILVPIDVHHILHYIASAILFLGMFYFFRMRSRNKSKIAAQSKSLRD